ncbi:MAG: phospholipase D family protein [Candidatus Brocadiales bacterium]|nr:phospholipase D family protein [Candidatus Brocadiales bacterium]
MQILHNTLWPTITRLVRKSKRNCIAVAYLGKGACKLLPLGRGDSLLVDMSEGAVKSGQTCPEEVEKYYKRGVSVYTRENLHAKVYVLGDKLIVGSANVSQRSRHTLLEAGLLCQNRDVLTLARGWVKSLMLEPVTSGYLKLCKKWYRPPKISKGGPGETETPEVPPSYPSLWVISVKPCQFSEQEERLIRVAEVKASKKLKDPGKFEVESIRYIGKNNFTENAKEGDLVVEIWKDGNKRKVYPPSRILRITRYRSFDHRKLPRMFSHIEMSKGSQTIPWRDFRKRVARVGLRHISPFCVRRIRNQDVRSLILGLWV